MASVARRAGLVGAMTLLVAGCGEEFRAADPSSDDAGAGAATSTTSTTASGATGGAGGSGTAGAGAGAEGGAVSSGGAGAGGGQISCVSINPESTFPATGLLDDFDSETLSGIWQGQREAFQIDGERLAHLPGYEGQDSELLYQQGFCPDQEAWVTLETIDTTAASIGLQLKAQGTYNCEQLEVNYEPAAGQITIYTCIGGTWSSPHATHFTTLQPGDQLGARALGDGTVQVFRNGALLLELFISWARATAGGRVGVAVFLGNGTARFDDFGGG